MSICSFVVGGIGLIKNRKIITFRGIGKNKGNFSVNNEERVIF